MKKSKNQITLKNIKTCAFPALLCILLLVNQVCLVGWKMRMAADSHDTKQVPTSDYESSESKWRDVERHPMAWYT